MDDNSFMEILSERSGESVEEISHLTESLVDVITRCALEMDTIVVPSFGSFEVRKRKERLTVHPASGKRLLVPPKMVIGFKPSTILKNKLK